jgi:hypothetical protein
VLYMSEGNLEMKRSVIAALGVALIVTLGGGSVAQSAIIDFSGKVLDGSITYMGTSLDVSTELNLDSATFLVTKVGPGTLRGWRSTMGSRFPQPLAILFTGPGPDRLRLGPRSLCRGRLGPTRSPKR